MRSIDLAQNLLNQVFQKYAPDAVKDPHSPNHWKEKVLYMMVIITITLGFVVYIMDMIDNIRNGLWMVLLSCTMAYIGTLIIFFSPKIRFSIRALIISFFIYFIGLSVIYEVGPFLAAREWLFFFSIVASLSLGWTGAILSIITNLLTFIGIGALLRHHFWENTLNQGDSLLYWYLIVMDLGFINVCATILITIFFIHIAKSDRAAKTNSQLLLKEGQKLTESNRKLGMEIEDRKAVTRALRESEEKYRSILESIKDAYFEVDLKGNLTFFNKSLRERLGYGDAELIGRNYRTFTDEKTAEKMVDVFRHVYTTGRSSRPSDIEVISKDKKIITASALISLLVDNQGDPIGFQGLARDITEYKAMENQLRHAQKMEAVGTLAGGVAHDLNNILSGVVSYPELLLVNMPPKNPMRKPIQTIKSSGEKAVAIVQDLLTLARRGVAVKDITNLNDIVTEYLQSTEFKTLHAFHPHVRIETQLDPALANISGSPVHLSKTIMNLVSNAAEAIATSGFVYIATKNQSVRIAEDNPDNIEAGSYAVLTIRDTGDGIAPDDQDKIFEPFFTKKVMGRSGTGLGMAVVWGTIKDHGGHIRVRSAEGQGTTFTIYFPASRQGGTNREKPVPVRAIDNYKGNGETILIVDDVETQREIATAMLNMLGYKPVSVDSGEAAIAFLKDQSVDMIILDMIMKPGIDGLETYQRIIARHPGQKAIITSGFSETDRVKEAQRLGAGQYIRKPYSIEGLGSAIKTELAPRKAHSMNVMQ